MNSVKFPIRLLILLSGKKRNIIFDIASLRLIKFTSLPGRLKISNTSTVYPAKKGYPKSCVRYLELTTHKTPCLPHRYEPDQTCILPTRKEDTSSGGVHKFGVLSSNIRLLLNRTPLGKPNQEISWKKEGSYAVEETDTWTKHFDTTLICKLSTPSPDKFACCARHGLEEVRIEEDSRR